MISNFENEHFFLSNFYPSTIEFEGITYPTVEHAFQAAKTLDISLREKIAKEPTPSLAKRAGRALKLRLDWENVKDEIMLECLRIKFTIPELREKLVATDNEWLEEGNTWHDNYWGNCSCPKCVDKKGKNKLGYLLCCVRKEIMEKSENILVVVDMQNDFVSGVLGNAETKAAAENVVNVVRNHVTTGGKIAFTLDTHTSETYGDSQEGKHLPVPHCIKGDAGWQIIPELMPYVNKGICFEKNTFGSRDLAAYLVAKQKEIAATGKEMTITFVGVCTDICVISNVLLVKAFLPETPIFVVADACAGVSVEKHNAALEVMKSCQVNIL